MNRNVSDSESDSTNGLNVGQINIQKTLQEEGNTFFGNIDDGVWVCYIFGNDWIRARLESCACTCTRDSI